MQQDNQIEIQKREAELERKILEDLRARLSAEGKLEPHEIEAEVLEAQFEIKHKQTKLKEFKDDPYNQKLMETWRSAHDKIKKPYPIFWNAKLDKYVWVSRRFRRLP